MHIGSESSSLPFRALLVVGAMAGILGSGCSDSANNSCGCVTGRITWGNIGGIAARFETSALDGCNSFTHQRTSGETELACEQPLGDCTETIGAEDIRLAVINVDVQAAIAAAPVLYGEDLTVVDGTLFRMQIQNATVDVGYPCATPECKAIPAGVGLLAKLLETLTKQELARAPCSEKFPPSGS
jgi:hypothetical protein